MTPTCSDSTEDIDAEPLLARVLHQHLLQGVVDPKLDGAVRSLTQHGRLDPAATKTNQGLSFRAMASTYIHLSSLLQDFSAF